MAINEIQGSLVLTQISLNGTTGWKVFVCEQGSKFDGSTNVTVEKTKCGSIKAVDDPDWKMSGDGVANRLPASDEVSFNELMNYMQNTTKVHVRKISSATSTLAEGDAYFRQGEGYFTSLSEDTSNGTVVKFTYNFEVQGDLLTTMPNLNFDTTLAFASATTDTDSGVTGTVASTNATIQFEFAAIADTEGLPNSMSITVSSTEKMTVDYDSEYEGQPFKFTDTTGTEYTGVFTDGTVAF